ncbi:MAG: hypothetical protein ACPGWS_05500, partial [Solirubrobacterales bacterium]
MPENEPPLEEGGDVAINSPGTVSMFSSVSSETIESVSLRPEFEFELDDDLETAVPGDDLGTEATIRNTGANLDLTGNIEVAGLEGEASVSSLMAYVEYRSADTGEWLPLGGQIESLGGHTPEFVPPITSGLALTTAPVASDGVTNASPETAIGTVLEPGSTARWAFDGRAALTPAQISLLADPAQTSGVRFVYRAELKYLDEDCPDPQVAGEPVVAALATDVQSLSGTLFDVRINATLPDDRALTFDSQNTPGLAEVAPGEEIAVDLTNVIPPIAGRGAEESSAEYLARLTSENGRTLSTLATINAQIESAAGSSPTLTPIDPLTRQTDAIQFVPVVQIAKSGPELANAGSSAVYDIELSNSGGATAALSVEDRVDGVEQPVSGAPSELAAGQIGSAQASVLVPSNVEGITDTATVNWTDRNGNEYGSADASFTTAVAASVEQPEAPPVDAEAPVQTFADETKFLYEGDNAVQVNVDDEAFVQNRVAVIRGLVKDVDGELLSGVKVSVLGHPEYGSTVSRVDGGVYLAVNGGEPLTLSFEKSGYIVSQRRVEPVWNEYTWIGEDVAMVKLDQSVVEIDVDGESDVAQVAQSDLQSDERGSRRSTLIFNPGTTATAVQRDGTETQLDTASVRSSEFTVGPNGPEAMPGELPPMSAYTYAAALTADEAIALGADHVVFNKPVINYVENFLNFPVGQDVPSGYQDPKSRIWIPDESGRVVEVLAEASGEAVLDVNGDGDAATPIELEDLGIGELELTKVAELYDAGESLWRVPVTHFSDHNVQVANIPLANTGPGTTSGDIFNPDAVLVFQGGKDYNWPARQPAGVIAPPGSGDDNDGCQNSTKSGSILECESQTLGETVPLEGIPSDLSYSTNRMSGFEENRSFTVPLSGDEIPESLASIRVVITVAGRREVRSFDPEPNQNFTYVWDGKDAFGRAVTGSREIEIRVGYAYGAVYGSTTTFAQPTTPAPARPNFVGSPYFLSFDTERAQFLVWQSHKTFVSQFNPEWAGLGGWSLDFHHFYDPKSAKLYRGDDLSSAASPVKLRQ